MSEFKLILTPDALDVLATFIEAVSQFINQDLAVCIPADEKDPDLCAAWEESLRDSIREDSKQIISLINNRVDVGELVFNETEADAMLRLCSAIRLKMYQVLPDGVEELDLNLETGEIEMLSDEQSKVWRAAQFLAGFQEYILMQLDPGLSEDNY